MSGGDEEVIAFVGAGRPDGIDAEDDDVVAVCGDATSVLVFVAASGLDPSFVLPLSFLRAGEATLLNDRCDDGEPRLRCESSYAVL